MSRFVQGYRSFLVGCHDARFLLQSADDSVNGVEKILSPDGFLVVAGGDEGSFVADVGDVGTRKSWCLTRKEVDVDRIVEFERFQVDFEDGHTLLEVGQVNVDLAVKAAGAQQGFVEDVDAVGGRKDDDAGVRAEAVHLCEQLVEGVLTFVVTTEGRVLSAGAANGVDFVNEDDAGRLFLGLAEEVAHTAGTNADEHLDKIGAGKREKRHVRFTCHCFGQESLARSRWTDE